MKLKHDEQIEQLSTLSAMFDDFIEHANNKSASLQQLRSMSAYSGATVSATTRDATAAGAASDKGLGKQLDKKFYPRPSLLTYVRKDQIRALSVRH